MIILNFHEILNISLLLRHFCLLMVEVYLGNGFNVKCYYSLFFSLLGSVAVPPGDPWQLWTNHSVSSSHSWDSSPNLVDTWNVMLPKNLLHTSLWTQVGQLIHLMHLCLVSSFEVLDRASHRGWSWVFPGCVLNEWQQSIGCASAVHPWEWY